MEEAAEAGPFQDLYAAVCEAHAHKPPIVTEAQALCNCGARDLLCQPICINSNRADFRSAGTTTRQLIRQRLVGMTRPVLAESDRLCLQRIMPGICDAHAMDKRHG